MTGVLQGVHVGEEEDEEWVKEQIRRGARGAAPVVEAESRGPARAAPRGPGTAVLASSTDDIRQSGANVLQALQQTFNRFKVPVRMSYTLQ